MIEENPEQRRCSFWRDLNATRVIVSTLGVLFALSGLNHGIFETLQGNTATGGWFIHSIGPRNQMWPYGTEDAFTLIPNFLITGAAAIAIGLLIIIWSIGFVQKKHGSPVFFILFVLLLLVGGGVAQVVFFTLASAVSTRINRPVRSLQNLTSEDVRALLGKQWLWLLIGFTVLGLIALEIAIVGFVPGVNEPMRVLHICWSALGLGLVFLLLAILSGLIHDADRNRPPRSREIKKQIWPVEHETHERARSRQF